MTTLQIVLLVIIGAIALTSAVFMTLFIIEISVSSKEEEEVEVKSIFSSENYVKQTKKEENVDSMLAKLDEQAQDDSKNDKKEEKKEEAIVEPVVVEEEKIEEKKEEVVVVPVEEPKQEIVETVEETKVEEVKEEPKAEEVKVEETKEEPKTEEVVDTKEDVKVASRDEEFEVVEETESAPVETVEETKVEEVSNDSQVVEVGSVAVESEQITPANLLDYKARLASVIESRDKLNKDLIKIEKSILNYERTKRRKTRNQKMLDRRASELTNLNLVMYSVTDIKNVDEEKKIKQEELTTHIAELKASIQDAEEFLESNKEKNDHDIKMAKFLIQEKARFKEEIAELEALIAKTEGTGDATAV